MFYKFDKYKLKSAHLKQVQYQCGIDVRPHEFIATLRGGIWI